MVDDKPRPKRKDVDRRKRKTEQGEENHVLLCAVENVSIPIFVQIDVDHHHHRVFSSSYRIRRRRGEKKKKKEICSVCII